jgi:hypothetical protein
LSWILPSLCQGNFSYPFFLRARSWNLVVKNSHRNLCRFQIFRWSRLLRWRWSWSCPPYHRHPSYYATVWFMFATIDYTLEFDKISISHIVKLFKPY